MALAGTDISIALFTETDEIVIYGIAVGRRTFTWSDGDAWDVAKVFVYFLKDGF